MLFRSAAIKFAQKQIVRANTDTMVIGTNVKFTGKYGQTILGTVKKINRKYIIVAEQGNPFGNWRVPAQMLTVV